MVEWHVLQNVPAVLMVKFPFILIALPRVKTSHFSHNVCLVYDLVMNKCHIGALLSSKCPQSSTNSNSFAFNRLPAFVWRAFLAPNVHQVSMCLQLMYRGYLLPCSECVLTPPLLLESLHCTSLSLVSG